MGPSDEGVQIVEFGVSGNAVRGMKGEVEEYQRFLREANFDVVMTYAAQQWTTDAMLPVIRGVRGARVLAPCGFSGLRNRNYRDYFANLPLALREFDGLITHSKTYQDALFIQQNDIQFTVIPNGADEREFAVPSSRAPSFRRKFGISEQTPMVLVVGSHTGLKGHSAAISAFMRSKAAAGATLVIIGNSPLRTNCLPICRAHTAFHRWRHADRNVVLCNPSRELVVSAFTEADVLVMSSMVECSPLVLFEACAAGLPFIAADVGNSREIAEWTGGGRVVTAGRSVRGLFFVSTRQLADEIDRVLSDNELRQRLADSGRKAWLDRFTWDRITSSYEDLYADLVKP